MKIIILSVLTVSATFLIAGLITDKLISHYLNKRYD